MTGPISSDFSFKGYAPSVGNAEGPGDIGEAPFGGQESYPMGGDGYSPKSGGMTSGITIDEIQGESPLSLAKEDTSGLPPAQGLADAVQRALAGDAARFVNGRGEEFDLGVQRGESAGGLDRYDLAIGNRSLQVRLPAGQEPTEQLARVLDFYTQHPPGATEHLRSVTVESRANPEDAEWGRRFGMSNFVSAATAGGSNITFWNNGANLAQDIFDHEMGHILASNIPGDRRNMVPEGWETAARGDTDAVSPYARTHMREDFAESWNHYLAAQRRGPEAQADFASRFPSRTALLDQMYQRNTEHGIGLAGSPPSGGPAADTGSTALGRLLSSIFGR